MKELSNLNLLKQATVRTSALFVVICFGLWGQFVTASTDMGKLQDKLTSISNPTRALALIDEYIKASVGSSLAEQVGFRTLRAVWKEKSGSLDEAIAEYSLIIELLKDEAVSKELINAYQERSYITYLKTNDTSKYCEDRKMAVSLSRQLDDLETLTKSLTSYSFCFNKLENFQQAFSLLKEALAISKENDFPANRQAMIYNSTALLYNKYGLYDKAKEYTLNALELWTSVDDRQDMFNMLHTLVALAIAQADWASANNYVSQLFNLAESSPSFRDFYFFYYYNKGLVAFHQRNFEEAVEGFSQAIERKEETQESYFIRNAYAYRIIASYRIGNRKSATRDIQKFFEMKPNGKEKNFSTVKAIRSINSGEEDGIEKLLDVLFSTSASFSQRLNSTAIANSFVLDASIASLENKLLKEKLTSQELRVKAVEHQQKAVRQQKTIFVLLSLLLAALVIFLALSRQFFKKRSQTDYLTQIANRSYMIEKGRRIFESSKASQQELSVIVFDIDDFKRINDSYGHDIGDKVIIAAAKQAARRIRDNDIVGRIGGEEFMVILPAAEHHVAYEVAERIRKGISEKTFLFDNASIKFSVSIGVATIEKNFSRLEQLVQAADVALYQAKDSGKNKVCSANKE